MLPTAIRSPRAGEDIAVGVRLARMHGKEISPAQVARVLREAGVKYVLVGAHAANGYSGRPRATIDVDVIVHFPKKAVEALTAAFPALVVQDTPFVTRFMDGDVEAIDLMKSSASKLWARLFMESVEIALEGEKVRIPVLEGVLAAKFSAMMSPNRRLADKQQDAADFVRIVDANPQIDLALLRELAELIYAGAGDFAAKLVDDARAGRRLEF